MPGPDTIRTWSIVTSSASRGPRPLPATIATPPYQWWSTAKLRPTGTAANASDRYSPSRSRIGVPRAPGGNSSRRPPGTQRCVRRSNSATWRTPSRADTGNAGSTTSTWRPSRSSIVASEAVRSA